MRAIKIATIVTLLLFLLIGGVLLNDLRYPAEWDQIHLGMDRTEVTNRIGPGMGEWRGWTGSYWHDEGVLLRNQLHLYIDGREGVTIIDQDRFLRFPALNIGNVRREDAQR